MLTSKPAVSVLMPAYNAERYVAEAVESILAQTFTDFEFLIIDDGSTDGTRVILERFAACDGRIRFISRPNTGYLVALNEMITMARGELLARMDADDIADPDRFAQQVAYLEQHPECVAVGSRALIIDPDGDPLCEWFPETSHGEIDARNLRGYTGTALCHPSVMMRRESVVQVGSYHAEYYTTEDLDLWLRLAEVGQLANLPTPLLKYRIHPSSICQTSNGKQRRAARAAIAEARVRRGLPAQEHQGRSTDRLPMSLIQYRWKWGWWALTSGHVETARKHALRGLFSRPLSLETWRLLYCSLRGW